MPWRRATGDSVRTRNRRATLSFHARTPVGGWTMRSDNAASCTLHDDEMPRARSMMTRNASDDRDDARWSFAAPRTRSHRAVLWSFCDKSARRQFCNAMSLRIVMRHSEKDDCSAANLPRMAPQYDVCGGSGRLATNIDRKHQLTADRRRYVGCMVRSRRPAPQGTGRHGGNFDPPCSGSGHDTHETPGVFHRLVGPVVDGLHHRAQPGPARPAGIRPETDAKSVPTATATARPRHRDGLCGSAAPDADGLRGRDAAPGHDAAPGADASPPGAGTSAGAPDDRGSGGGESPRPQTSRPAGCRRGRGTTAQPGWPQRERHPRAVRRANDGGGSHAGENLAVQAGAMRPGRVPLSQRPDEEVHNPCL